MCRRNGLIAGENNKKTCNCLKSVSRGGESVAIHSIANYFLRRMDGLA